MAERRRRQRGQFAAFAAIFLALVMGTLMFGMVNLNAAFQAYGDVDTATLVGAEDGAAAIQPSSLYSGPPALDPTTAPRRCLDGITTQMATDPLVRSYQPSCQATGDAIIAAVTAQVRMFTVANGWGPDLTIRSTHEATATFGAATPS